MLDSTTEVVLEVEGKSPGHALFRAIHGCAKWKCVLDEGFEDILKFLKVPWLIRKVLRKVLEYPDTVITYEKKSTREGVEDDAVLFWNWDQGLKRYNMVFYIDVQTGNAPGVNMYDNKWVRVECEHTLSSDGVLQSVATWYGKDPPNRSVRTIEFRDGKLIVLTKDDSCNDIVRRQEFVRDADHDESKQPLRLPWMDEEALRQHESHGVFHDMAERTGVQSKSTRPVRDSKAELHVDHSNTAESHGTCKPKTQDHSQEAEPLPSPPTLEDMRAAAHNPHMPVKIREHFEANSNTALGETYLVSLGFKDFIKFSRV